MSSKHKHLQKRIRHAGLRVTLGRVALLHALEVIANPVSLDSPELVRFEGLGDRATVYRNLVSFADKGLVLRVSTTEKRDFYEAVPNDGHAHVTCVECGKVECFEPLKQKPLPRIAIKGWRSVTPVVAYQGVCKRCRG